MEMETEMIKLKNEVWLEEEELPITSESFRNRVKITTIRFYDDLSSEIYCDDGDIFWGHTIVINIDKKGNYKQVNLAG
jgi:hypothetical protein